MTTLARPVRAGRPGLPRRRVEELIRARGGRYFPDLPAVVSVRVEATHRPAYSDLHQVAIHAPDGLERRLVVKVFDGAAAQFQALEAVWPHFAMHPRWGVPRPLDIWDEGPALVMEHVAGRPLQAVLPRLLWAGPPLARATEACRRTGLWLGFYHRLAADVDVVALDSALKRVQLGESLDALAAAGLDRALCERLRAPADRLARSAADEALPVSHVHGEFTVDNVLADGPRIIGLDLWARHRASVAHDLASFLGSLVLLRLTRPVPWAALERLQRAFLSGYFGSDGHLPAAVLLLQMMGIADAALEILERRRSRPSRAWVRRIAASSLDRIAHTTLEGRHVV